MGLDVGLLAVLAILVKHFRLDELGVLDLLVLLGLLLLLFLFLVAHFLLCKLLLLLGVHDFLSIC